MSLSREMSLPIILALALAGCFAAENSRDDQMRVISFMQDESSPLSGDTNNYETESTFFNDFIDSNPYSTSPELNGPVEEFLRLMFPKMMNCSANEMHLIKMMVQMTSCLKVLIFQMTRILKTSTTTKMRILCQIQ
ncbi:uncharacterized protein O3C94_017701 isoform 2-T2 [Discoglossus pictus]